VQNALSPLFKLVKHIQNGLFDGDFDYSKDEIGQLALQYRNLFRKLHKSNELIRQSEVKFRKLFNNANDAIFIHDFEGNFLEVNQKGEEYTGYTRKELLNMNVADIDSPDTAKMISSRLNELKRSKVQLFEATHVTKSGESIPVEISSCKIEYDNQMAILSVSRDLAERKRYEEKLRQAQKMEAIGTLAGGIAHDFNNLLMGIQGRASLMSFDLEPTHPCYEHVNAILDYTRSSTDLTKQLIGVARGGKFEVKPMDINKIVSSSATMFGRTKKEIRIHTKLHTPPPVAMVDRMQIEQVLLNLFVNAWQAMPQSGVLYLETSVVLLDEAYCKPHSTTPGTYAKISVTDTGIGMEEAILPRIFDPFFTTKKKERGTGLGLSSAYGIVKNHGGIITVYSEVGHGTNFNIYLPLSDKTAEKGETRSSALIKGSETILLIDDEQMITEVGQAMLEKLGYRVVVANSGEDGIAVINEKGAEVDLVILDMIMPGMDGGQTFERIREIHSAIPVILSSGYSLNGQAEEILKRGCKGFIQKPFDIEKLSRKLRDALEGSKSDSQK
jgi:PAS domain S-box-containing protein